MLQNHSSFSGCNITFDNSIKGQAGEKRERMHKCKVTNAVTASLDSHRSNTLNIQIIPISTGLSLNGWKRWKDGRAQTKGTFVRVRVPLPTHSIGRVEKRTMLRRKKGIIGMDGRGDRFGGRSIWGTIEEECSLSLPNLIRPSPAFPTCFYLRFPPALRQR